jgi:hypothetical protein
MIVSSCGRYCPKPLTIMKARPGAAGWGSGGAEGWDRRGTRGREAGNGAVGASGLGG